MADQTHSSLNEINLKNLLVAGSHFGSKTSEWNPKTKQYIYGIRNKVYIIDLENTVEMWQKAREFVVQAVAKGGKVLFVGTKPNVQGVVKTEAERCGAYFVNQRWLGGTLSNYPVTVKSLNKLKKLEAFIAKIESSTDSVNVTKLEMLQMKREVEKLNRALGGFKTMRYSTDAKGKVRADLPAVIFVTDTLKEDLAIKEARTMGIPVVALIDTNSDPEAVTHPVPANDDSTKGLALFVRAMADAVVEGNQIRELEAGKDKAGTEVAVATDAAQEREAMAEKRSFVPTQTKKGFRPRNGFQKGPR